ncbi:head-tail connector protein [Janthinobacterium sp. PLB04]|uniref:Phage gp6-like head-tail connector protein n=1 Tax=Janthinobacterium lividum TaxID=29581 RepID=A0AAJ4T6W1_9BURK|nr:MULTISPECIES: head-tail connector protein [Janthinobacterium]KAB0331770.1 phage gp6-like head-tail connector protein [Janthinobacterium lividum]QSX97971.1 phage gp6-like head-tail connector protein [Janthinobacterium lividum]UGQ37942.1 head-tail connector protein [Janthinobacterium sp. PLB04]
MFLTPELAKGYQRIVGNDEDDVIALILSGAEKAALAYLNRQVFADATTMAAAVEAGTAGAFPMVIEDDIKVAILKLFGDMYENREDSVLAVSVAELPLSSRELLRPHRVGNGV